MGKLYGLYLNRDTTEGRGPTYLAGIFEKPEDAVQSGKGKGVMGTDSGVDVYELIVNEAASSYSDLKAQGAHVWGYRKDNNGRWGYGWVDLRDAPPADPEYAEYLRLQEKFKKEGRA